MNIEIKKGKVIQGEQLYDVIVNGETIYSNCSYEFLITITIGDLDRVGG